MNFFYYNNLIETVELLTKIFSDWKKLRFYHIYRQINSIN